MTKQVDDSIILAIRAICRLIDIGPATVWRRDDTFGRDVEATEELVVGMDSGDGRVTGVSRVLELDHSGMSKLGLY